VLNAIVQTNNKGNSISRNVVNIKKSKSTIPKKAMKEHVRILTDSAIVINRIAQILDENKIPSLIKDNFESARLAGFGSSPNEVQLYVYESDVDKAKKIIKPILESNQQ
jgi:hypothetical protein